MTERERLAELISEYILIRARNPNDERPFCEGLADYLLDHGIIVPPCKVGDTVYYMYKGGDRVYEGTVTSFIYVSDAKSFVIHCDGCHGKYGQYVFLTREEAEAALVERRRTQ